MTKISVFQLKITISFKVTNSMADRPCKLRYLRHGILGSCERPSQRRLRKHTGAHKGCKCGSDFYPGRRHNTDF